ncbi:hypothetical protein F2P81_011346 [Scophthalmus maximus]|uniref:Uncharacterized protein n=1 Tax=Scophthalmus maximus TaxID=52904 RepID=A0A6A4SYA7_SCOMX|nr:hypothetical protein F2P81_011346 [Scophthalmus maximus]
MSSLLVTLRDSGPQMQQEKITLMDGSSSGGCVQQRTIHIINAVEKVYVKRCVTSDENPAERRAEFTSCCLFCSAPSVRRQKHGKTHFCVHALAAANGDETEDKEKQDARTAPHCKQPLSVLMQAAKGREALSFHHSEN